MPCPVDVQFGYAFFFLPTSGKKKQANVGCSWKTVLTLILSTEGLWCATDWISKDGVCLCSHHSKPDFVVPYILFERVTPLLSGQIPPLSYIGKSCPFIRVLLPFFVQRTCCRHPRGFPSLPSPPQQFNVVFPVWSLIDIAKKRQVPNLQYFQTMCLNLQRWALYPNLTDTAFIV